MKRWDVNLYWFDDDSDQVEIEADTLEEALLLTYEKWHPTGWTHALLGGVDLDLEASTFQEATSTHG